MENFVNTLYSIVWSPVLIVVLVGAGLYFSIRTRFVQIRRVRHMAQLLSRSTRRTEKKSGFSSFQAFCVALSGRVGTGNIVGVATAIAIGGPGSVFWMWVIALLGASTAFMEATLAQMYKFPHKKGWRGGPAVYIEDGLGKRWLGIIFALLTILGYGLLLTTVQANSVGVAFENSFSINPIFVGIVSVLLMVIIAQGGDSRIAKVSSFITPFMAIGYIVMSLIIIGFNYQAIPGVFRDIFSSAFGFNASFGGIIGSAISMGVKRGLYSNEAGQGGGAIVAANANVKHPAQQGLVQAFSVYIDTLAICTCTALMILCTGKYNVFGPDGSAIVTNDPELGSNYVGFAQAAIDSVFNDFGSTFIAIALAFFVFTTFIAYYFYAESSIIYIFRGRKRREHLAKWIFRILMAVAIIYGTTADPSYVWTIGDIGLGLTTWVNVIVLLILCPKALEALKEYEEKHIQEK